jgi:outer membrane protein insertion porin family
MRFMSRVPAFRGLAAAALALRVLVLYGAIAGGLVVATPAPVAAQQGPAVSDVVVIGNRRVEAATVASYLTLGPGDPITAQALNESVHRLFDTGLFRDASIAVDGRSLIVRVEENPTINRVAFEGNDALSDEELLASVSTRPRRAFTRSRVEADAQTIGEIYRRVGRYGTEIEPVIIELPENRVDLVFEIDEGDVTGVNAISFVGNEVYSDRRLRSVIETTETGIFGFLLTSDIYDPDRLEFDRELLRRYYLGRGYADFTVLSATAELAPDRDGFFITFTVSEGELYTFGEQRVVTTAPGLDPADFEPLIDGAPGDTYDADLVENNINRIIFQAGQQGFAFIDVRPRAIRDPEARTVGVVYELSEGPRVYVERIDIEGNSRTLDRVIRRQFDVVEGDAFNSRAIQRAESAIRGLGYFETVTVRTERGSSPDRARVVVEVEEQSTGSLSFGLGFSTDQGPLAEVNVTERNFLGRGQFFRARAVVAGDEQVIDFSFREPAFLDRDLEAGFDVFYRQEDRSDESSFEETNIGFTPSIAFPVSENGRLRLNYQISSDEIRDVNANASPFIARDEGTAITSLIGYRYSYDQRNDPFDTTEGYLLEFGQDFAGLGGDAQYVRTTGLARAFTSFFDEDVVTSVEVEGGYIWGWGDDDVKITDRFFLGGDRLRGFERDGLGPRDQVTDDSLGGNAFAVVRTEVSFPLGLPEDFGIYGGLFSDFGTLWDLETTSLQGVGYSIDDSLKMRGSVGASLFWDSLFGPLRVNVAYPFLKEDGDREEIFRLTAGTRF